MKYDVGDVIEYRPHATMRTPTDLVRRVRVTRRVTIAGYPAFEGSVMHSTDPHDVNECWGYDTQIVRVVRRKKGAAA